MILEYPQAAIPKDNIILNTIIVAVAVPSFPPQHSPMFGHFASSQTYKKAIYNQLYNFTPHNQK